MKFDRGVREVRIDERRRLEGERERGVHRRCRNWLEMPADGRRFGEKSGQPGGTVWRGRKGKEERRSRAFYRHGERPNYSGVTEN
jgi:hypothetical protein